MELTRMIERGAQIAAEAFVSGVWQGMVLATAVWLLLRLIPRTTAAVRFAVWGGAFVVLALLPLVRGVAAGVDGAVAGQNARGAMLPAVHVDARWGFAIAAVWMVLSTIRAAGLVVSAVRLRGIWKRATPVDVAPATLEGRRAVQLCTSTEVDCPSVIGFLSPRVLIPTELFDRLTEGELEQIVLHEIGHLRRADDWINLLQKVGLVLFPLNPALLWIERRLCFERELACDDGVLQLTRAPKAYATCLTTLAEHRLDRRGLSLSLGAWERQSTLSRRVHSILRWREGMGRTQARVVLSVLVLGLLGGAAGMARCPQLVSFSTATPELPREARALPGGEIENAVFRPAGAAHETLLKASMPSTRDNAKDLSGLGTLTGTTGTKTRGQTQQAGIRRAHRPILQRVNRQSERTVQQWIVLTSWNDGGDGIEGARIVLTVARPQTFSSSYAAVPTPDGWLILQL